MARPSDPYRTLGLPRDASLDEVKRAYRRLAKANHPDAAGEAALPRFLAIQAAYDRIVGGPAAGNGTPDSARGSAGPRQPWEADPSRADATHRAYGGRSRRTRSSAGPRARPEPGPPPPSGGRRPPRAPNKATLGSTSYDGAEAEPFDPDWGGASWYGTTSGTYWTLNPKEYADPRKHGPEYQARARRARAPRGAEGEDAPDPAPSEPAPAEPDGAASGPPQGPPPGPARAETATHTTTSWWDATAGPAEAAPVEDVDRGPAADEATAPSSGAPPWSWLDHERPGMLARLARAVLGWIPVALAFGWLGDEVTGCGRLAADCDGSAGWLVLLAQLAVLGVLLAAPRIAAVAAVAGIATLAVAVPAALVIAATTRGEGAAADAATGMVVLGGLLAVAWLGGATVGVARALRTRPRPVS